MEFRAFKTAAKAACDYLSQANIEVPHNRMLEALSHGFFGRGWSAYREALAKGRGIAPAPAAEEVATQVRVVVEGLLEAMVMQERRETGEFHMTASAAWAVWSTAKQKGEQLLQALRTLPAEPPFAHDANAEPVTVVIGEYRVQGKNGETASTRAALHMMDGRVSLALPAAFEPGEVTGPVLERRFSFEDLDDDEFQMPVEVDRAGMLFVARERLQFVRSVMTPR